MHKKLDLELSVSHAGDPHTHRLEKGKSVKQWFRLPFASKTSLLVSEAPRNLHRTRENKDLRIALYPCPYRRARGSPASETSLWIPETLRNLHRT